VKKIKDILERIAATIQPSQVIGKTLVLLPLNHVLRGFMFERSSVKGHYFLRRLVLPLYRRDGRFAMNYSTRISRSSPRFDLVSSSLEAIVNAAMAAIDESNSISTLKAIDGPEGFLRSVQYVDLETSKDPNLMTDIALSYFLSGNNMQCCKVLQRICSMPVEFEGTAPAFEAAAFLLEAFRTDPRKIVATIDEWERRTKIAVFGEGAAMQDL
jgi:hypothetical protein